jgi:hypothetical protein
MSRPRELTCADDTWADGPDDPGAEPTAEDAARFLDHLRRMASARHPCKLPERLRRQ